MLLVVAAGALNGTYALPLKGTKRWAWENTWLVYSAVGMVIAGWAVALVTVPHVTTVYADAGLAVIGMVFLFGMLWGVANFLFGLAIDMLGISLALPLAIGLSLALGSLLTLAAKNPAAILSAGEVFCEYGLNLCRMLQPATTIVLGCSNGVVTYLPTAKAIRDGGYEPNAFRWWRLPGPFTEEAEAQVLEAAAALAKPK